MSSIAIPAILDRLAHVGVDGLPYPNSCQDHDELELCRSWHYRIECREGRARLEFDHDQLVPSWIVAETPAVAWEALRTEGYLEIGSTNEYALRRARQGASTGTLIFAEAQTAGRGRLGRQWFVPPRGGLCFSLIVCPLTSSSSWPLLTHVASTALAFAIRELESEDVIPVPLDLELKWPNDVLISGKKAAGILLETVGTGKLAFRGCRRRGRQYSAGIASSRAPGPRNLSERGGRCPSAAAKAAGEVFVSFPIGIRTLRARGAPGNSRAVEEIFAHVV